MTVDQVKKFGHLQLAAQYDDDVEPQEPESAELHDTEKPKRTRQNPLQKLISDCLKRWAVLAPGSFYLSACGRDRERQVLQLSPEQIRDEVRRRICI
jgi:hypothetical protein